MAIALAPAAFFHCLDWQSTIMAVTALNIVSTVENIHWNNGFVVANTKKADGGGCSLIYPIS